MNESGQAQPREIGNAVAPPGARIAVGLSGGVDSAMAAWLLRQAGHELIGITMQIWDGSVPLSDEGRSGCYGPGEARDIASARATAARLGIPYHEIPLADAYRAAVLDYFRDEYRHGRTPNPCVVCNRQLKFGLLLAGARARGLVFDSFATGHYARRATDTVTGRQLLLRGRDATKDQSYFLAQLNQAQLAQSLFPLGERSKSEVRQLAIEAGFPELAEREESQDFVECKSYDVLLGDDRGAPGPIIDRAGRELGRHDGLAGFTIGQRKGLGLSGAAEPYYVVALDTARHAVVVGRADELQSVAFAVRALNWIALAAAPAEPRRVWCRIRQRHAGAWACLTRRDDTTVDVRFETPQTAITPGQLAVFYDGDSVLGSGTIEREA